MAVLLDTSVLARLANPTDPMNAVADHAIDVLARAGENICITPQVLIEFRAVATRPTANNGLGYTPPEADAFAAGFEAEFLILPDTTTVYPTWRGIVRSLGVIGKTVHDARLVAVCHVYTVTHLFTFNVRHFRTLAAAPPGLVVLDPATV